MSDGCRSLPGLWTCRFVARTHAVASKPVALARSQQPPSRLHGAERVHLRHSGLVNEVPHLPRALMPTRRAKPYATGPPENPESLQVVEPVKDLHPCRIAQPPGRERRVTGRVQRSLRENGHLDNTLNQGSKDSSGNTGADAQAVVHAGGRGPTWRPVSPGRHRSTWCALPRAQQNYAAAGPPAGHGRFSVRHRTATPVTALL